MTPNRFVADPHWGWMIVAYFYFGGIAAGSYAAAALARLFGDDQDARLTKAAHYLAFPLVSVCGVLLIVDLNRPERFWHMLIASETYWPMFKWYSPMSVGSWGLSLFGGFSLLSFLSALSSDGVATSTTLRRLLAPMRNRWFCRIFEGLGTLAAFFLGAYTGTLLSATNQPVWAQSDWISALFLSSAASTGAAAILAFNQVRPSGVSDDAVHRLERLDRFAGLLELALLVVFVADLGRLGWEAIGRGWGLLLPLCVVPVGLILPISLAWRPGSRWSRVSPWLVLAGGLALRMGIVGMARTFLHEHH